MTNNDRYSCGLLRRTATGAWYYGEIQVGTDETPHPGALERAILTYQNAPEPVLREWKPKEAEVQLNFWPVSAPIIEVDRNMSLHEASTMVFANIDRGTFCPCCQRAAHRVPRSLHREMAVFLVYLVRAYRHEPRWYHLREVLPGGKSSPKACTDGAYMTHWGLIKRHPEKKGVYMPMPAGQAFVLGQISVPKTCWVYDGRPWHFSKEVTTIREVLGKRVDVLAMLRDTDGPHGR